MPHHWIRISTGTPARLRDHVGNAPAFDRELRAIVSECNGKTVDVFFDDDAAAAYVLVDGNASLFDLDRLDRELDDPKTFRVDLLTVRERVADDPSQEEPPQYEPAPPDDAP